MKMTRSDGDAGVANMKGTGRLSRRIALAAAALLATCATSAACAAPPLVTFTSEFPWDTGYNGSITIQNNGDAAIFDWVLTFTDGPSWSNMWNATSSVQGSDVTITHMPWNATIASGATVTIGFTGVGQLAENVVECAVNGVPATVAYVGSSSGGGGGTPAISIGDAQITLNAVTDPGGGDPGTGFLSTSGNQIVDDAGNPVRISGVNWFGFETSTHVLHGLWARNYKEMLAQVHQLGFNTVRIPYCNAMLNPGATTNSINFSQNPDLQGLSPIEVLDKVIAHCGALGLRVILDRHSALADNYFNEDVWYIPGSATYTEQRWIDDWTMLANRYEGNPTVIGADLFNEPKKTATWGDSNPATDWNKAAERCANAILAANPDWLIIVEGTEKFNGQNTWWGGNLAGAAAFPVVLDLPGKLVYSMHDYPASVYAQSWFGAPEYPANLDTVWHGFWGYLFEENTAPLLLGEFGSKLATTSDQLWLDTLTDYIDGDLDLDGDNDLVGAQQGMSWTYWCLNPNSGDTGGILGDDWITVNTNKMAYLQPSLAPMLGGAGGGSQPPQIMLFPVTLSDPAGSTVTVSWSTIDGSAVGGVDFVAASGTLVFGEGAITKNIQIVIPPHTATSTTQFTVALSAPSGATLADASAIGTIVPSCVGDLDGSGQVDGGDLGIVLAAWGQSDPVADLDGNGAVDGADLGVLLAAWGGCP